MAVDLTQFLQTFFEECFESLAEMEQALLRLDLSGNDLDTINSIFRGAHSIKGASATFGITGIANYTHVMETLLDDMRAGRRCVTQKDVDVLLSSIDELREMLSVLTAKGELDAEHVAEQQTRLEQALNAGGAPNEIAQTTGALQGSEARAGVVNETAPGDSGAGAKHKRWKIFFKPHGHLLRNGNDPLRIFNELAELGTLEATSDASALPGMNELDPESSYLAWTLELETTASRGELEEVFAWVDGECELDIQALPDAAPEAPPDIETPARPHMEVTPWFTALFLSPWRRSSPQP